MIRRILIGLLIVIFLYGSGGYYYCFSFYQYSIKREIKQLIRKGINENELTEITVPYSGVTQTITERYCGIVWIKPAKEFKYHGQMFDVVKSSLKDGKKHFLCINDKKEKNSWQSFLKLKPENLKNG